MKRSFLANGAVFGAAFVLPLMWSFHARGQATATDAASTAAQPPAQGKEAEWIWSPAFEKDEVPSGVCYFRKSFESLAVRRAEIHIAADNGYEIYLNGQRVGAGNDWRAMDVYNITEHVRVGRNTIAVKATNVDAGTAGLVARVLVQHADGSYAGHSTDDTWRTSVKEFANWQQAAFPEEQWVGAMSYGPLGDVLPWGNEVVLAGMERRFAVADEQFAVERLLGEKQTGSLIAMCFNHRGDLIASQEGGPLLLLQDLDRDGKHEAVTTFCDQVKNVQGILPVGSRTLAVGEGPDGGAVYSLADGDKDGRIDDVRTLLQFDGSTGEHGAHAVRLGPDGYIYIAVGNFARIHQEAKQNLLTETSPYRDYYEGDLVTPRHEDPRGHAVGVQAPGGTILRTDAQGSFVEVVAGGLRNAYDFAFAPDGEIFTYDADMEWDIGAPWYRPNRILHVTSGAEFGWRSGWAKWPDYFVDSLPGTLDMGHGSPTGVEIYEHYVFPTKYHGAVFAADWARGRINAVFVEPQGATYAATSEVFVEGTPLNVTDLAVGPDGALYFCTGGRGTEGGLYRVRFTGTVPPERSQLGQGLNRALRGPQLDAPWSQAQTATLKRELGAQWGPRLEQVARNNRIDVHSRVRAIDLLQLYGPQPNEQLLLELTRDTSADVRARAALLLGAAKDGDALAAAPKLIALLQDSSPRVRRLAAESIVRRGLNVPADRLIPLLEDEDRFVRFAARRALERQPVATWRDTVLGSEKPRVFIEGSIALLAVAPDTQTIGGILQRGTPMLGGSISDADLVDLLRVMQLALIRGEEQAIAAHGQSLGRSLLLAYPTTSPAVNRELVRLLVFLQVPEAAGQFVTQIESTDVPHLEKLHIAAYAPRLRQGWTTEHKIAFIKLYELARAVQGGYSLSAYVENFAREFFAGFTPDEKRQIIRAGGDWPTSALSVLAALPPQTSPDILADIRGLDRSLEGKQGDTFARLRVGIVAVLARSSEAESLAHLREVYQTDPERRPVIAMALTQNPAGDNWPILVDSLRIVEGPVAMEILSALARVNQKPAEAAAYRDAIVLGLKSDGQTAAAAARLLTHWTGATVSADLHQAQAWYSRQFPDAPPAVLPENSGRNRWSYEELVSFLASDAGRSGDARRGMAAFKKAQCAACHRFGTYGEGLGPDLTTVVRRFHTKEILEAIVYPSHVISDQYASKVVEANGRTYNGLTVPDGADTLVVLTSDGRQHRIPRSNIDSIEPSSVSVMPDSLLNILTLEEVADLFAYLRSEPRVAEQPPAASSTNR